MTLQFNELSSSDKDFQVILDAYLKKRRLNSNEVSSTVAKIIDLIRIEGDRGLKKLTYDLDGFVCENFLLTDEEKEECLNGFDDEILISLKFSFQQLLNYQTKCFSSLKLNTEDSITRRFRKIDKVGMYIPGGKASYPSTVLMGAAPAIACGIKDIYLASPAVDGKINDLTVAAAKIAGIEKIYKIGGAQAIAALALGTDKIPKVDKIIGPGNVYVAEAKKQLFGEVGIDSIAGPSEILILADESSDPETVAWDLMAQSEHDVDASSVLISTSSQLIQNVKEIIKKEVSSLERCDIISQALLSNGLFINIDNLAESKKIINSFAPEHLHIAFDHDNFEDENSLKAGLILKGKDSANSLSDYVLGPSHILPTNSSANFSSPLSVEDFLVSYSYVRLDQTIDPKSFKEYVEHTSKIANAEGLTAHAISAEKRLKD